MRTHIARWARQSGLALVLATVAASSAVAAPVRPAPRSPHPPTADVTASDIAASNAKLEQAYGALVAMWSADFKDLGARFVAPQVARYRGNVRTSCGVMSANNAAYCAARNTIFFDEVFVARQAKAAAEDLGTDGDMAGIGIIAHEMGHAVAIQLGEDSRIPYENEAAADCLAGAFTQRAAKDGTLEKGDLEEAFFGLAAAGDPTPEYTGNRRIDRQISLRAQLLGHGTRQQRLSNFRAGYEGGASACLSVFH
ncbi:MAG: neutral zinc metallopeptidase [Gemmatimonadaceae bacterium]